MRKGGSVNTKGSTETNKEKSTKKKPGRFRPGSGSNNFTARRIDGLYRGWGWLGTCGA